jgi:hypothetical protein
MLGLAWVSVAMWRDIWPFRPPCFLCWRNELWNNRIDRAIREAMEAVDGVMEKPAPMPWPAAPACTAAPENNVEQTRRSAGLYSDRPTRAGEGAPCLQANMSVKVST